MPTSYEHNAESQIHDTPFRETHPPVQRQWQPNQLSSVFSAGINNDGGAYMSATLPAPSELFTPTVVDFQEHRSQNDISTSGDGVPVRSETCRRSTELEGSFASQVASLQTSGHVVSGDHVSVTRDCEQSTLSLDHVCYHRLHVDFETDTNGFGRLIGNITVSFHIDEFKTDLTMLLILLGPSSWLSICSIPGVNWVCERTGSREFSDSARDHLKVWTKRMKLQGQMSREKSAEPDGSTARRYSSAFFDHCFPSVFGIVHRPAFEARLNAHLHQGPSTHDDVSWYALRNIVFAFGCRAILARDKDVPFPTTLARAWSLFENAMSVHNDLLYTPTTVVAVQALALMTFFVQGLGGPVIEFMLSSSTVRLAQSKGLHRQPSKLWQLPESELLQRNCLFWAIYCCEKAIILRSGRPSAIDDDDVSSEVPGKKIAGSTLELEFLLEAIKHARIGSRVSKELGSARALRRSTAEIVKTTRTLDQELHAWREQLPESLQFSDAPNASIAPTGGNKSMCLQYLQSSFYGSMITIHSIFHYPWVATVFDVVSTPCLREQVAISTARATEAARNIILATKSTSLNANFPSWLAFYYPMLAAVNLFVSILKAPLSVTSRSNLALLDIATGHFAHLEFLTPELSFPFVRESANLAHRLLKNPNLQNIAFTDGRDGDAGPDIASSAAAVTWNNVNGSDSFELDMEDWSAFAAIPVDNLLGFDDWPCLAD
ncbi:hypothetical protein PV11_06251 [Exophiala sideris]|uniref:Xylanolytic transcriptional activator regulatory domain-containing protein n=1 Tax=Exophiala sideris TaxID=1016849 RepID=A0A0D1Y6X2_9EURO|nr:hypothetical protein PV11_06251 [Exophiala sideris]